MCPLCGHKTLKCIPNWQHKGPMMMDTTRWIRNSPCFPGTCPLLISTEQRADSVQREKLNETATTIPVGSPVFHFYLQAASRGGCPQVDLSGHHHHRNGMWQFILMLWRVPIIPLASQWSAYPGFQFALQSVVGTCRLNACFNNSNYTLPVQLSTPLFSFVASKNWTGKYRVLMDFTINNTFYLSWRPDSVCLIEITFTATYGWWFKRKHGAITWNSLNFIWRGKWMEGGLDFGCNKIKDFNSIEIHATDLCLVLNKVHLVGSSSLHFGGFYWTTSSSLLLKDNWIGLCIDILLSISLFTCWRSELCWQTDAFT